MGIFEKYAKYSYNEDIDDDKVCELIAIVGSGEFNEKYGLDDLKKMVDENNPSLTSAIVLKTDFNDELFSYILQNLREKWCEYSKIDFYPIVLYMTNPLSQKQLQTIENHIGLNEMISAISSKYYDDTGYPIHQAVIDYVIRRIMKGDCELEDNYSPLAQTQNCKLVQSLLDSGNLNEKQLSYIVNNKNLPNSMRVDAFNSGYDPDSIFVSIYTNLPKEIISDLYKSCIQSCCDDGFPDDSMSVSSILMLNALVSDNVLPYECQLDYLMRFTESKTLRKCVYLANMLSDTKYEGVLIEATKLKNKNINVAYENVLMPYDLLVERVEKLIKDAQKYVKTNKPIPKKTIERLSHYAHRVTLPISVLKQYEELNDDLKLVAIKNAFKQKDQDYLNHIISYCNSENNWMRAYAFATKIASKDNTLSEENVLSVTLLLDYLYLFENPWYSISHNPVIFQRGYDVYIRDLLNDLDNAKKIFDTVEEIGAKSRCSLGTTFNEGKGLIYTALLAEEQKSLPFEKCNSEVLRYKLENMTSFNNLLSLNTILKNIYFCEKFNAVRPMVSEIESILENREKEKESRDL